MPDNQVPPSADQRIGANVARLRGSMSQKALAEAMRGRGWKWSQATVWAIEKGERPLRLAEADALLDLLGIGGSASYTLMRDEEDVDLVQMRHQVSQIYQAAIDALFELREAQLNFSSRLQSAYEHKGILTTEMLMDAESWLADTLGEDVLKEADARWKKKWTADDFEAEVMEEESGHVGLDERFRLTTSDGKGGYTGSIFDAIKDARSDG